jgi:RNA polymerase sigma-70 factor, ECF subfamily
VAKTPQGLTIILSRARAGDERAGGELIALIYNELRGVASRMMLRERAGHSLPPTAVVHEAVIRRFPDAESLEIALGRCLCTSAWN